MEVDIIGGLFGQEANSNEKMVRNQIIARGIRDPLVVDAFMKTDRAEFVPDEFEYMAYNDHPLSIGSGQTISQPYIVALMTQELWLKGGEKVLEIGTGSGYQTAILARIAGEVYSVERIKKIADRTRENLDKLGIENVYLKIADGFGGWPEQAPYDAIIVTAAPEDIPRKLMGQLKDGGRMVLPVGERHRVQMLVRVTRKGDRFDVENLEAVGFVPMVPGVD